VIHDSLKDTGVFIVRVKQPLNFCALFVLIAPENMHLSLLDSEDEGAVIL
jgi:hypothetical protein